MLLDGSVLGQNPTGLEDPTGLLPRRGDRNRHLGVLRHKALERGIVAAEFGGLFGNGRLGLPQHSLPIVPHGAALESAVREQYRRLGG